MDSALIQTRLNISQSTVHFGSLGRENFATRTFGPPGEDPRGDGGGPERDLVGEVPARLGGVEGLVGRFDRRGIEPFELFTSEFGQHSVRKEEILCRILLEFIRNPKF